MNDPKPISFKAGDVVTARTTTGIPVIPRNFHPMKDRGKELAEYKSIGKTTPDKLGAFSITMVYPPHERGGRYRIIKGEQYKILIDGNYVFFNAKSESKNKST